jgi:hypothetical protein
MFKSNIYGYALSRRFKENLSIRFKERFRRSINTKFKDKFEGRI